MIELINLTKKYDTVTAVENVSLKIERHSPTVIVGPSGSGKTTLLRLIAGLEVPDAGEILIDGEAASVAGKILIPPHRRKLGMIFQDLALWPHMKVLDNLEFGLKSLGIKKNLRKEKIENIMNLIQLDNHLNRYPPYLSEGEKQRVALARTLILEPAILLMDEPLSNIDPMHTCQAPCCPTSYKLENHFQHGRKRHV